MFVYDFVFSRHEYVGGTSSTPFPHWCNMVLYSWFSGLRGFGRARRPKKHVLRSQTLLNFVCSWDWYKCCACTFHGVCQCQTFTIIYLSGCPGADCYSCKRLLPLENLQHQVMQVTVCCRTTIALKKNLELRWEVHRWSRPWDFFSLRRWPPQW